MHPPSMPLFRREAPWMLMMLLGLAPWLFLPELAKVREAWDSPLFMMGVLPTVTLAAAIAAWIAPERAVLMAPAAVVGQLVGLFSRTPTVSPLWIMGAIFMLVLHAPALGAALASAALRRRLDRSR